MNQLTTIVSKDEGETSPSTWQVTYAEHFLAHFADRFRQAEVDKDDTFGVSVKEWDDFRMIYGFGNLVLETPKRTDIGWTKFRQESNTIRYAMNTAASIGQHGEPPFELVTVKKSRTDLQVRLLTEIVSVTHLEIVKQIKTLLENKTKKVNRMTEYMAENVDNLSPMLNLRVKMLDITYNSAATNLAHILNTYTEEAKSTFNEVHKSLLESDAKEAQRALEFIEKNGVQ